MVIVGKWKYSGGKAMAIQRNYDMKDTLGYLGTFFTGEIKHWLSRKIYDEDEDTKCPSGKS